MGLTPPTWRTNIRQVDKPPNRRKDQAGVANGEPIGPFIVSTELADLLRQPESTIRYWRHVGRGPRWIRMGRRVVYDKQDVLAWLEQQRGAAAQAG